MVIILTLIQCFPQDLSKSIGFLEDAVLWLNSWPIQKKLGIKGFVSVSDETEASLYRCAKKLWGKHCYKSFIHQVENRRLPPRLNCRWCEKRRWRDFFFGGGAGGQNKFKVLVGGSRQFFFFQNLFRFHCFY